MSGVHHCTDVRCQGDNTRHEGWITLYCYSLVPFLEIGKASNNGMIIISGGPFECDPALADVELRTTPGLRLKVNNKRAVLSGHAPGAKVEANAFDELTPYCFKLRKLLLREVPRRRGRVLQGFWSPDGKIL